MIKFVVLSVLLCFVAGAPAPGFLHGGYALPAATSYSSRVDVIHSAPIVKTYAAPVITKTLVAAPAISYSAPIISSYGHGLGHGLEHGLGHGLELGYGGLEYGHGHGHIL